MINQNKYLTREEIEKEIDDFIEESANELILELKNKNGEIKTNKFICIS